LPGAAIGGCAHERSWHDGGSGCAGGCEPQEIATADVPHGCSSLMDLMIVHLLNMPGTKRRRNIFEWDYRITGLHGLKHILIS
jgi:hypothetical protein